MLSNTEPPSSYLESREHWIRVPWDACMHWSWTLLKVQVMRNDFFKGLVWWKHCLSSCCAWVMSGWIKWQHTLKSIFLKKLRNLKVLVVQKWMCHRDWLWKCTCLGALLLLSLKFICSDSNSFLRCFCLFCFTALQLKFPSLSQTKDSSVHDYPIEKQLECRKMKLEEL